MNAATLDLLRVSQFTSHSEQVRLAGRFLGWVDRGDGADEGRYRAVPIHHAGPYQFPAQIPFAESRDAAIEALIEASTNYDARRASTKVKRYPSYSR